MAKSPAPQAFALLVPPPHSTLRNALNPTISYVEAAENLPCSKPCFSCIRKSVEIEWFKVVKLL